MRSRWNQQDAQAHAGDDLAVRVYSSRLLGADEDLVMHGGGNTSVKSTVTDGLGRTIEVLLVKGSGWDLSTIEKPGFPALRLDDTRQLASLDTLSDLDMTTMLRSFMLDPAAPSPSVEAILHAIIPARFVDHTHADAVVTLTNNPDGQTIIEDLYPDCLILPYVMPGFILSKQVATAIAGLDLASIKGIILLHHGVFTFADDAQTAYESMIELVDRAQRYITERVTLEEDQTPPPIDLRTLAAIRKAVSLARGKPQLAVLDASPDAAAFASRPDLASIATRGPITPDHVIRTKRIPVLIEQSPGKGVPEVAAYADDYRAYFNRNTPGSLTMLDPAPRVGLWHATGAIAFGSTPRECAIITDINRHTRRAIATGERLGGWAALPEADIFELEYWSLEQAKLTKSSGPPRPHLGKVAMVTGAASGIGRAAAETLAEDGAQVVALDINPAVTDTFADANITPVVCDLTDESTVKAAVEQAVASFGGLDILVANAGIFNAGETIEEHTNQTWDQALAVNLTATRQLMTESIAYLKLGIDPSILIVGSRNVAAPGPGAAAYSASKAALTQLARVAALELAESGIRVNIVHPDAVFDTDLWTDDALERSAARYGLSVNAYKTKNLLGVEITSNDVARMLSTIAGPVFRATTGAQIPVDGGNDRVI
jgi:rhamnose utilization protein RhaD (predicted bifunctional aldolase and dehydrogenase)/NAD(P)-dependent dehydrogenase (short-subunit alcohol dehydrogenase family)